ncbi:MAG: sigma-70 family RNA polymerase sigma factor [Nannocystaceae bacterium]
MAREEADDIALLEAWRAGDKHAGSLLFRRHYELVHRFFRSKVNASHLGDLIQSTFLACVEGRDRYQGTGAFRSYVLGIAYRLLGRHYRAQRRERARIDFASVSACDLAPSPSRVAVDRDEQRLLLRALRRIPVDHQVILELFYWEGFTAASAAEVLGIPLGTAKSRIRRARQLLHEQLAALAESPALLESTVMDLEGWVRGLREQVGKSDR